IFRSNPTNRTWAIEFDSTYAWKSIDPPGALPPARYYHTAVYDSLRDRMIVYGGDGPGAILGDRWALEFSPPAPREPLAATAAAGATGLELYRQQQGGAWSDLGSIAADGQGRLAYHDASTQGGAQYDYGIGRSTAGPPYLQGAITVRVPAGATTPVLVMLLD